MLHCSIISGRPDPGPEDALMNRGLGEAIATLQRLRKPEAPAAGRRSQRPRPVDWRRRFNGPKGVVEQPRGRGVPIPHRARMDARNFKGQSVKTLLAMLAVSGLALATPVLAQGGYGDRHNGSSMGDQHMNQPMNDRNAGRGDRQNGDHHMDGGHWMGGYHRHHQVCWWRHHRQVCTWR